MKLQQAIKTMQDSGWSYIRKDRCTATHKMDYYFRSPMGNVQVWNLAGLRIRAERQAWVNYSRAFEAKLKKGIQLELFANWEIEEMAAR